MHLVLQEAAKHYEYALSILYLRCLRQRVLGPLWPCISPFNSLFEMPVNALVAPGPVFTPLTFQFSI